MKLEGFSEVSELLKAGVYALVAKGQVIYVGKSKAMLARVYTHRQNWISRRKGRAVPDWLTPVKGIMFDEIHIRPCALEELDRLEAEMINRYKPKLNERLKTQDKIEVPVSLSINGIAFVLNSKSDASEGIRRRA